ncbi:MAG: hypothetical protein AAFP97_06700 [Pseudomonadota bacterium]
MFKPNLFILAKDGTVDQAESSPLSLAWARTNVVVISRALCAFEHIRSNSDVSASKRRRAAELQARLNSPFEEPGLFLEETGDDYIAWTWDAASFEAQSELPVRFGVPESAGLNLPDGLHLLKSIDGYEGRLIENGTLLQSRWWPHMPSASDWRLFLARSNQRFGEADLPKQAMSGLNIDQLTSVHSSQPFLSRLTGLPVSTQLSWLSVLILPIAAFIGIHLLSLTAHNFVTGQQVDRLEVELAGKRATANRLRQVQTQIQGYAALSDSGSLLLPVSLILEKVDTVDGDPRSMRIFDNQLEFVFRADDTAFDPVAWVREFEATDSLADVSMAPSTQRLEWVIEARVESSSLSFSGAGQ